MKHLKQYFNLIEVVLALGVAALGVAAIMGLIPVAINSTKNSVADSFAADAANTFFSKLDLSIKKDWEKTFTSGDNLFIPDSKTALPQISPIVRTGSDKNLTYKITRVSDGLYTVWLGKKDQEYTDFSAHVRIWKTLPNDVMLFQGNTKSLLPNNPADKKEADLLRVYTEISWPVSAKEEDREKRIYVREYYNPLYY